MRHYIKMIIQIKNINVFDKNIDTTELKQNQ